MRHHLTVLAAVLLVGLGSLVAAARIGAVQPDPPGAAAYVAIGGDLADLCGDPAGGHHAHCPFCHLLSDPPDMAIARDCISVLPGFSWPPLGDLIVTGRRGNPNSAARAPPALI